MTDEEIIKLLYDLSLKLQRNVVKKDLNKDNGLSFKYWELAKRGISLKKLNFNIHIYNNSPNICKHCKSSLPYAIRSNSFCSKTCAAKTNNVLFPKRKRKNEDTLSLSKKIYRRKDSNTPNCMCGWCKKEIYNKKYCSNKCHSKLLFQDSFLKWYNNEVIPISKITLKNCLETLYGYKCAECNISEYDGERLMLHLEHIDGNALNNKRGNICLLCPNCHSQTSTYKGRNRGNGQRAWRREAYKNGKSY